MWHQILCLLFSTASASYPLASVSRTLAETGLDDDTAISLLQMLSKRTGQSMLERSFDPLDHNYAYYVNPNGRENYCGAFGDIHVEKTFGPKKSAEFNDVAGVIPIARSADNRVIVQGFSCPVGNGLTSLQAMAAKFEDDLIEYYYQPSHLPDEPLGRVDPMVLLEGASLATFMAVYETACKPLLSAELYNRFVSSLHGVLDEADYYAYAFGKPRGYYNSAPHTVEMVKLAAGPDVLSDCATNAKGFPAVGHFNIYVNGARRTNWPEEAATGPPRTVWRRSVTNGFTPTSPIEGTNGLRWSMAEGQTQWGDAVMIKKGQNGNQRANYALTVGGTRTMVENHLNGYLYKSPLMTFGLWINPNLNGGRLPADGSTLCNAPGTPREPVPPEAIIFSAAAQNAMCGVCNWNPPQGSPGVRLSKAGSPETDPMPDCKPPPVPPTPTPPPPVPEECAAKEIPFEDAQAACEKLKDGDATLYKDCMVDFCASDGNPDVIGVEELESHEETTTTAIPPTTTTIPTAIATTTAATTTTTTTTTTTLPPTTLPPTPSNPVVEACPCTDPAALTLKTPAYSNLAGAGPDVGFPEGILYPDAGVIHGRAVNVHLQATSPYSGKAAMNGVKGTLGRLNLKCGSTLSFTISVKDAQTGEKINVGNLPVTFLDLDEGKRGSGRTTVSACNSERFMANPTELAMGDVNGCPSVTSSTAGTAKDNPASVEGALVDPVAKMRVASFVAQADAQNQYAFTINLAKGFKQRGVLFAINSGMACVEGNIPATCVTALADEEEGRQPRVATGGAP